MHSVDPEIWLNCPAGQGLHADMTVLLLNWPAGHGLQIEAPGKENVPTGHICGHGEVPPVVVPPAHPASVILQKLVPP